MYHIFVSQEVYYQVFRWSGFNHAPLCYDWFFPDNTILRSFKLRLGNAWKQKSSFLAQTPCHCRIDFPLWLRHLLYLRTCNRKSRIIACYPYLLKNHSITQTTIKEVEQKVDFGGKWSKSPHNKTHNTKYTQDLILCVFLISKIFCPASFSYLFILSVSFGGLLKMRVNNPLYLFFRTFSCNIRKAIYILIKATQK